MVSSMPAGKSKPRLHIDWATYKAAKYACQHWHYSQSLPGGGRVQLGVWEDGRFVGVVVYGIGSGNATNGSRYGLRRSHEMADLARVALRDHQTPVSRIVAVTLRLLHRHCPGLRLIISMADPRQGHHGGIYQAGNWIYTGETAKDYQYQLPDGRWVHHRTATRRLKSVKGCPKKPLPGKHRYLMPLDDEVRERIKPLAKPYPTRGKQATSEHHSDSGGATPTPALQDLP